MTFLPIVARELRVASRRRMTYWARAAVALGAMITGIFIYADSVGVRSQLLSQQIFVGLIGLSLLYCLLAGRFATADCLSAEKREGTLGLLFLTDLKPLDVVLGKLAATSLNGFYSLLAVLPVLAVPLLMGGVANGEFWRVVLVLVNSFLFSLAIGLFVSALTRDARLAMGAHPLLLIFLAGLPPACAAAISYFSSTHVFVPQLLWSCPVYSAYLSDDSNYRWGKTQFWASMGVIHLLTWGLLSATICIVPRAWQDRPSGKGRWREWWAAWVYGRPKSRGLFRKRLLDINAFYWLAARAKSKPVQVWLLFGLIAGWWVWACKRYGSDWQGEALNPTNVATAIMFNCALKLWVGIEAAQRLAEDRKAGAFEWLLTTPLTVQDIVHGQWLALRRQFLFPSLTVLLVELFFLGQGLRHASPNNAVVVPFWLGAMAMLIVDIFALGWVGMSFALLARSPSHAIVGTIMLVLVLPWGALWVVQACANWLATPVSPFNATWQFYLDWWFALGLGTDLLFGWRAWSRLHTGFRELAGRRFASRRLRFGLGTQRESV
jgi:ABC-type transport system involved in multi-copper enzyme maturation permease subunit